MAKLAHIHRTIDRVAKLDIVGDRLLGGRTTIAMTGVHQFIIVTGIVEHPEETVPMGSTQEDDVILIDLTDGLHTTLVKWL